jgi:hypothetical protein
MTTKSKGITKAKLTKYYPKIAKIVDDICEKDKAENYWFYVNYSGKYKDRQGNPRTVSMGAIIELMTNYGYEVEITAKKR